MAKKDGDEPHLSLVTPEEADAEAKIEKPPVSQRQATRRVEEKARRVEAMTFRMAGLSWEQVADRMDMSVGGVRAMVERGLERADQREVENMRAMENARLDRAQAAIWSKVLNGDYKAIDTFLRISQRRSKINGMDAPMQVDLNVSIRQEMEQALNELETMVLGPIVQGEVVRGDSDPD
jgi:transposase